MIEVDSRTGNKFFSWNKKANQDLEKKWSPVLNADIGKPLTDKFAKLGIALMLEQQKVFRDRFIEFLITPQEFSLPSWYERANLVLQYSLPLLRRDMSLNVNWEASLSMQSSIKWVESIDPHGVDFLYSIIKADFLDANDEIQNYFKLDKSIIQIAPLFAIDNNGYLIRFN